MIRLRMLGVLAAVTALIGLPVAAQADGYGAPNVQISANDTSVVGGRVISGSASSNLPCLTWTVRFNGPTSTDLPITGSGTSISYSIRTQPVSERHTYTLSTSCTYETGTTRTADTAARTATVTRSVRITLLAKGGSAAAPAVAQQSSDPGVLLDTGGPRIWIAVAGVVLVLAGAGVVVGSRRRVRA